ncbi:MAG: hypothetical protein V4538_12245 [Bacteroidota bacterium]
MYKVLIVFVFVLFCTVTKSQVLISVNSKKKLDTIEIRINSDDRIILLVDSNNKLSKIHSIKCNELNGFQYYLNKYFLDSIVKYSNNLPTNEKYISSSNGELNKIYQSDGSILDSNNLKLQFLHPQNGIQLRPKGILKLYEYDSLGRISIISDIDSNYNKNGESINVDEELHISQIRNWLNDISIFFDSNRRGIGIYDCGISGKRYNIWIWNRYNEYRTISEIDIYITDRTTNERDSKTIKIKKSGKVKGLKRNANFIW